jgi:hypothetical protein
MVSQGIEEMGGRIEAATSIRKLSNHSPLTIAIWGNHPPPNNPTCFFDTTVLNEEKGKMELLNAWARDAARPSTGRDWVEWLEKAMERVANCNKRLAKEKKRAQGARVRSCTKKIHLAELQLQRDPTNSDVRGILSDAQSQLAEEFQAFVARNRHLSSAKTSLTTSQASTPGCTRRTPTIPAPPRPKIYAGKASPAWSSAMQMLAWSAAYP